MNKITNAWKPPSTVVSVGFNGQFLLKAALRGRVVFGDSASSRGAES